MVRKLWYLCLAFIKYLDFGIFKSHNFNGGISTTKEAKLKRAKYTLEMLKYIAKIKLIVANEAGTYAEYAEAILLFLN